MDSQEELDKSLEMYNLSRLNQEGIDQLPVMKLNQ